MEGSDKGQLSGASELSGETLISQVEKGLWARKGTRERCDGKVLGGKKVGDGVKEGRLIKKVTSPSSPPERTGGRFFLRVLRAKETAIQINSQLGG